MPSRQRVTGIAAGPLLTSGNASRVRPVPRTLGSGRRLGTVLVLLSAALALLVAASDGRSAQGAVATNSTTFQDSTGEDASAPDVTSVTVANDDQANLTFTVNVPNRPTLTGDMVFLVPIDSDANPSSGSADFGGADYVIELDGPLEGRSTAALFRWDGTDFTSTGVSQATLIFSYANGPTLKLNASEIGGTRRFGVSVPRGQRGRARPGRPARLREHPRRPRAGPRELHLRREDHASEPRARERRLAAGQAGCRQAVLAVRVRRTE